MHSQKLFAWSAHVLGTTGDPKQRFVVPSCSADAINEGGIAATMLHKRSKIPMARTLKGTLAGIGFLVYRRKRTIAVSVV
jgi:hypothetical protein